MDIIDGRLLPDLVEARAIDGATVLGTPGGWSVLVRCGDVERAIAAQRARTPRVWRNLATAATFVRQELGLAKFDVDALGHEPEAAPRRRPDQAVRMKSRHEAAAHDAWFRAEIERAIDAAESPNATWISHGEVLGRLDARIARLTKRHS